MKCTVAAASQTGNETSDEITALGGSRNKNSRHVLALGDGFPPIWISRSPIKFVFQIKLSFRNPECKTKATEV